MPAAQKERFDLDRARGGGDHGDKPDADDDGGGAQGVTQAGATENAWSVLAVVAAVRSMKLDFSSGVHQAPQG